MVFGTGKSQTIPCSIPNAGRKLLGLLKTKLERDLTNGRVDCILMTWSRLWPTSAHILMALHSFTTMNIELNAKMVPGNGFMIEDL